MMKKTNRILSFILVLALLFSSFVFTAQATANDEEYYVDENAERFTPIANYTALDENNANNIVTSLFVSGTETDSVGINALYGGSNLDAYVVTSETTEDYVMIVPTDVAVQNKKVTDHVMINTSVAENFKYDANNPTYYVFECDVATESNILPLFYQIVARNHEGVKDNGKTIDAWGGQWVPSGTPNSLYMLMTPGTFHHVTFIGDVDNNVLYVYVDNQLAAFLQNGVTSALMHSYYKNNGAALRIDGMRIQANYGIALNGNMSYCFKDLYEAVLTGTESGNLQDYVGKPTLQGWTGNRYVAHTDNNLPPIIDVNGVQYNNTKDASDALNSYKEGNVAKLMRSVFSGDITVDSDATIHTYTTSVSLAEGPHTTLTKVGGSIWRATLHSDKYSTELVASNKKGSLLQYLKYNLAGNLISEISMSDALGAANGANADIMKSYLGNEYIYLYDNSPNAYSGGHLYLSAQIPYSQTTDPAKKTYSLKGHDFIVYDFDIYSESEFINIYNKFVPRTYSTNKPLDSNQFTLTSNLTGNYHIQMESGIWNHFTVVGEVSTGRAYVYINNKLITTIESGLYVQTIIDGETYAVGDGGKAFPLDDVCVREFRAFQIADGTPSGNTLTQDMSVCADNFDARFVDGDASLVAGMEDLSGWITNLYGNGYQFPELPAIAAVDGVEYYDIYSLTEALTPNYPSSEVKNVVLLREFKDKFTVNCNAVIDARAFASSVEIGSECTATTSGNIITVTCPLAAPYSSTPFENNRIPDSAPFLSDVSGNLLTYVSAANGQYHSFLTLSKANKYHSDDYYITLTANQTIESRGQLCTSGCKTCFKDADKDSSVHNLHNFYFNANANQSKANAFTVVGEGAVGYYVVDFDISAVDNMLPAFDLSVVMRRESDSSGYPFSNEIYFDGLVETNEYWNHVTVVGDIANNIALIYVNGQYVGDGGQAVRNGNSTSYMKNDTKVFTQGFRIEITRNNLKTTYTEGQNVSFDNFAQRLYVNNNYSELAEAVAAGDLTIWSGYESGRSGEILAPIAVVDGVPYANQTALELALIGDKAVNVEIISDKLTSLKVNCDAVINTNGFNVNITYGDGFTAEKVGNIVTITGEFNENIENTNTSDTAAISDAVKYPAADNIMTHASISDTNSSDTVKWGEEGGRASQLITNTDNGNVFYKEYANGTVNKNGNDYIWFNFTSKTLQKTDGYNEYIVVDFDFAYETLDGIAMQLIVRKNGSGLWATTQAFNKIGGLTAGKFAHITVVYNVSGNTAHFFVNGEAVKYNGAASVASGVFNSTGASNYANGTALTTSEIRIGSNSTSTYYLDNFYVRYAKESTEQSDTLADAIANGTTRAWSGNVYTSAYTMTDWPAIATVNNIKYSYASDIQNVLDKADKVEMEYHRQTNDTFTFSSPATVKTNGLDLSYNLDYGYEASLDSNEGILTVAPHASASAFKLVANGTVLLSESLPYGTEISDILDDYAIGAAGKVFALDGEIYTNVTWSASKSGYTDPKTGSTVSYINSSTGVPQGRLYSDLTLTVTGTTTSDKPFLLLDASGAIVDNDYTSESLMNYFLTTTNGSIILKSDWVITKNANQITAKNGDMKVYLNGYTIRDDSASGEHIFRLQNNNAAHNISFIGGAIDCDKNISASAFIYTDYTYTGKITLKNLDIDTSYALLYLRSGNGEVIGCDIDAYLVQAADRGLFQLGENYNAGKSYNPMELIITNSDIDVRTYDKPTAVIVHRVVSNGYNQDPKTTVVINNSNIVSQYALVEAYRGYQTSSTTDTTAAQKSNMTVYLNKVSLVANSIANGDIKSGTVVFYEDVRTNVEDTSCVSFITELALAKTSDGLTPYLYTSYDYAAVTWSNGNAELWAGGSLPTHPTCKFDNIGFVEAGMHYDFTATMSSAPFKFYANLSFYNSIQFNLYIPTSFSISEVYLDGKLIQAGSEITYVGVAGTTCYNYSLTLEPHLAAKQFSILIVLADGKQMSRNASVGQYAQLLYNQINGKTDVNSVRDMALLKVALEYIKRANTFSSLTVDMQTINSIASLIESSKVVLEPTGTKYDTEALKTYFTGAQINVLGNCRYRFNVKSGTDVSDIRFVVNGVEQTKIVATDGSYVELELNAYDMYADVEIYVGDSETPLATYNLYTYYSGLSAIANGTDSAERKEAVRALDFIKALYTYAKVTNEEIQH